MAGSFVLMSMIRLCAQKTGESSDLLPLFVKSLLNAAGGPVVVLFGTHGVLPPHIPNGGFLLSLCLLVARSHRSQHLIDSMKARGNSAFGNIIQSLG